MIFALSGPKKVQSGPEKGSPSVIKYLLIGLGVLLFLAMAVGDGVGIMAFLKMRSLSAQSAQAQSAAAAGTAAKTLPAPEKKAPPKPTAQNANFVEIPQFVVTIPAPAPKAAAGADGSGTDTGAAAALPARTTYLQLSLSFLTESQRAAKDFGKLLPMIKSAIISDVMSSGLSPSNDPVKMKHQISDYSLQLANTIVSQADSDVGKTPFVGAYVTTFVAQ